MKITQKIIDELEKALDMRGKDGNPIWNDGDDISVNIAGTFKADKFITLTNRTKNPVISSIKPEEN
tara:strand:+ start:8026 stop:8223 length:198 start_codon:yes stop_codon:yes gene_type:complete